MRIRNHIFAVIGAFLITTLLASAFGVSLYWIDDYFIGGMSELRNHVEIAGPNKSIVVDSYKIYGGATSTDVTQVLIRHRSEQFDSEHNFCLLSIDGLEKTKITWVSDTQLEIQCEPGGVYKADTEWNGISVTYSELK